MEVDNYIPKYIIPQIYDILVNLCEAPEKRRKEFIELFSKEPIDTWMFKGSLGDASAFRCEYDGRWFNFFVAFSAGDSNNERLNICTEVNKQLRELAFEAVYT